MGKALSVLVLLASGLGGCSYMLGVSALPTLDDNGDVGFEARVTAGVGVTNAWSKQREEPRRTAALMVPASVGLRTDKRGTCFPLSGGLGFSSLGDEPGELGFKANVLGEADSCRNIPNLYGGAAQLAALFTLTRHDGPETHHYLTLGPLIEAALLSEADEDASALGRFALGPTLELYGLTYWDIGM